MSVEDLVLPDKFNVEELIRNATARGAEANEPEDDEGDDDADAEFASADLPPPEKLPELPQVGSPYKAHARPANQSLDTLCLVKADGSILSYPYACRVAGPHLLPVGDVAKNLVLLLRFTDADGFTEIHVFGRRLETLMNLLCHCRIGWIRELAAGKLGHDDEPVVTRFAILEHRKKKAAGKAGSQ